MTQKETLKLLKFNQEHENRKLTELNIILPILESEELKAWQACQNLDGDKNQWQKKIKTKLENK